VATGLGTPSFNLLVRIPFRAAAEAALSYLSVRIPFLAAAAAAPPCSDLALAGSLRLGDFNTYNETFDPARIAGRNIYSTPGMHLAVPMPVQRVESCLQGGLWQGAARCFATSGSITSPRTGRTVRIQMRRHEGGRKGPLVVDASQDTQQFFIGARLSYLVQEVLRGAGDSKFGR
jgi:hypothetical protein